MSDRVVAEQTTKDPPWPPGLGIVDTLMDVRVLTSTPGGSPVAHLFHSSFIDEEDVGKEGAELLLPHMDRYGIEKAMIDVDHLDLPAVDAKERFPDRFIASYCIDPNRGTAGLRDLVRAKTDFDVRAVSAIPSFYADPVPIDDRRFFPVYAKCEELQLPIFITCGVPGPAVACAPQEVIRLDEVCRFFPDLQVVMRHGGLPWAELAVSLMAKWPNLYYSTSAVAPKYYPRPIIDYANTRGSDRVMFAGYFPRGLSVRRTMEELRGVSFRPHVWSKFLRTNALGLLGFTDDRNRPPTSDHVIPGAV